MNATRSIICEAQYLNTAIPLLRYEGLFCEKIGYEGRF